MARLTARSRPFLAVTLTLATLAPALALAEDTPAHRPWSTVPPGPYAILPATPENFTTSDGVHISYAVHMPEVPLGARVPVILTAGPYFALEEEPVHVPSTVRLSGFLVENFVPHGYAVVAASVRGSGWSGGCMELLSEREGRDIDELATFLATREWSTGAVGLIGKSYDGSVAWNVARFGNPAIKTIVPISAITSVVEQFSTMGVTTPTAPAYHAVVYYPYGFGFGGLGGTVPVANPGRAPLDRAANAACPDLAESIAAGTWTLATGDGASAPALTDYWRERDWRRGVIEEFHGSVFVVHGLQDGVVEPQQAVPFFRELPQEKKIWLGQWAHQYPDEGGRSNRDDFAGALLAWFDRYLKGLDVATGPVAEAAALFSRAWRAYGDWPPRDGATMSFALEEDDALVPPPGARFERPLVAEPGGSPHCAHPARFTLPGGVRFEDPRFAFYEATMSSATRISGIAEFEADLAEATAGGIEAALCVGGWPVAFAKTTQLYASGSPALAPYVPGAPITVRLAFAPTEAPVAAGERIGVSLRATSAEEITGGHSGVATLTGGRLALPIAP